MKKTLGLPELADKYLSTEFAQRAFKTLDNHRYYLGKFVEFMGNRKIDAHSYHAWTEECFKRWAPQTAKALALAASSRFLNWMERTGAIEQSPHRVTKAPIVKEAEARVPITPDEYERLKAAASDSPLLWAIVCGWETGMAIGDVCLLTWAGVDLTKRVITVFRLKTHERCVIPLRDSGECLPMLEAMFEKKSASWPNRPEAGIFYVSTELATIYLRGAGSIQTKFAKIRDRAGVDSSKSFHNLRATFCSRLANGGVQTTMACQMTGHKNPEIFKHYVTPDVDRLREQSESAWKAQAAS